MTLEHELKPWLILKGDEGSLQPALWRLNEPDAAALVLFSTAQRAETYASIFEGKMYRVDQPSRIDFIRLLIGCYQQAIRFAVLDPDAQGARRVFDLKEVLKAAREELAGLNAESAEADTRNHYL